MRVAVISDTHFGDPDCALVSKSGSEYVLGAKYNDLKQSLDGGVDYLVLAGDIFDFSIATYEQAYKAAKVFFLKIVSDNLVRDQIIYIPGNHDFEFWHFIQYEVNVRNQMAKSEPPKALNLSVPCILDARKSGSEQIDLDSVTRHEDGGYGGLSLDSLTDGQLKFCVAYPNAYLITKEADCYLITHGQYLQGYWAFLGELAIDAADEELANKVIGQLSIEEMVAVNFPLNQLTSSGVGQSGILRTLVQKVQKEVGSGNWSTVDKMIDRYEAKVDEKSSHGWKVWKEWGTDVFENGLFALVRKLKGLAGGGARYVENYARKQEVRERLARYLIAVLSEVDELNKKGHAVPRPNHMIFGHTHEPTRSKADEVSVSIHGHTIDLLNTGGWLYREKNGSRDFVGANIYIYDPAVGGIKTKLIS